VQEGVLMNSVSKQSSKQAVDQLKEAINYKSSLFKANVFLNSVHGSTSAADLQRGLVNLGQFMQQKHAEFQGIIMTNAPLFSQCSNFFNGSF
jgi:hypothetical protein